MNLILTIKKTVLWALLPLYFIEVQNVKAQDTVNRIGYIIERFRDYCEMVPEEETFVMTDREIYIAGETLWFKVWLTSRNDPMSSSESKIIYWELLNPENKPVVEKRLRNEKGSCQGQVRLPDTLSTGDYTIRAYTRWMNNFLPENCFMKEIRIYNAYNSKLYRQKIYPSDELTSKPGKNSKQVKNNSWLTIEVNDCRPDTLELIINVSEKPMPVNPKLIYLIIRTHGNLAYAGTEMIMRDQTILKVAKNRLFPGINQIAVFDYQLHPVFERYIFTPADSPALSVWSADSFGIRSKVTLELQPDDPSEWETAGLCISVAPAAAGNNQTTGPEEWLLFGSEFGRLPWEVLKGRKTGELPRKTLDSLLLHLKSTRMEWNKVLSDNRPHFKYQVENEEYFLSGVLLNSDDMPAGPGEYVLLSIPGKVPQFGYAITDQDGRFCFSIPFNDKMKELIIQPDHINANFSIRLLSSFSDSYPDILIREDSVSKPLPPTITRMGLNYQVSEIYGLRSEDTIIPSSTIPLTLMRRFYGKPDFAIDLKDWVKMPSMEEVFSEIVPNVSLKKKGMMYEIVMTDPFGRIRYDTPPVMLVDGVIIRDPAILAGLDPGEVEKIDVVKEQYMVGDYLFNGIVNVITMQGDFSHIPLPDHARRIPCRIFDAFAPFVSPGYSSLLSATSREPDFRNTLYWNPSVKLGKEGKAVIEFWTSDIRGDYVITVQGITADGKGVSVRKKIRVR